MSTNSSMSLRLRERDRGVAPARSVSGSSMTAILHLVHLRLRPPVPTRLQRRRQRAGESRTRTTSPTTSTPGRPAGGGRQLIRTACRSTSMRPASTRRRRSPPASAPASRAPAGCARISSRPVEPHHHDQRHAARLHAAERLVERLAGVPRQHEERRRHAAMRHRNAGQLRRRHRRRHAGHDLEGDAGHRQRQRFFAAAAEDERVAALEPHDALAAPRGADHQPVNRLLLDAVAAARACRRRSSAPTSAGAAPRRRPARRTARGRRPATRCSARIVHSSGSPGPAPTRDTDPSSQLHRPTVTSAAWHHSRFSPPLRWARRIQAVQHLEQLRPPLHRHAVLLATSRRASSAASIHRRDRAGSQASSASRSSPAIAGARPPVEIAIVTPARRTTPPAYAVALGGSSTALTKMPPRLRRREHLPVDLGRRRRHHPPGAVEVGGLEPPPLNHSHRAARVSGRISGATTVTCAPAPIRPSSLPCRHRSAADQHDPAAAPAAGTRDSSRLAHGRHTVVPAPTTCSKSARLRPIWIGFSTRSCITSAVL